LLFEKFKGVIGKQGLSTTVNEASLKEAYNTATDCAFVMEKNVNKISENKFDIEYKFSIPETCPMTGLDDVPGLEIFSQTVSVDVSTNEVIEPVFPSQGDSLNQPNSWEQMTDRMADVEKMYGTAMTEDEKDCLYVMIYATSSIVQSAEMPVEINQLAVEINQLS